MSLELPNKANLCPREVQRFLAVSRSTIYAWLRAGKIPCREINGIYRIPRSEFIEWYDKHNPVRLVSS